MKRYVFFIILLFSHFSTNAEGISLSCALDQNLCNNCPDYQTIFPIQEFSENTGTLDVEADASEIIEGKYLLSGSVSLNSENLYLSANDVEVSSTDSSILATGNVKFQDESYLITSDYLSAARENNSLIATATNANYQDYSAGLRGANGFTEFIEKTPTSVLLTNSTYSLCPINKNDWLIDADEIELNLEKNRGVADNATVKFYGVPIFYTPKHSWVLEGRGSGFLTPNYSSYNETGKNKDSYSLRVPYYFNLAPDRDLLLALTYMSSRGFNYEGKYRQLIKPLADDTNFNNSKFEVEMRYLNEDKINNLKRWLLKFNEELDITNKTHLSAQYYRVSDSKYFEEIARTNTNLELLNSHLRLDYKNDEENLSAQVLTENAQVVNGGSSGYVKAFEASVSKNFALGQKKVDKYNDVLNELELSETEQTLYSLNNPKPKITNLSLDIVSTKFTHKESTKESGTRNHGSIGISRQLNFSYPTVTPRASVTITNYSLKSSPNINRTIFGSGVDLNFSVERQTNMFGYKVNHKVSPIISYNYKAKKVQGNIPLFDSTDKYDDIITFADLTSGERYTGLDRITNANDITLSLESTYRRVNALDDDKDLLSMKIAQTYFTDDEVVSDTANTNYETRKSYSDIAASIDIAVNNFSINSAAQYDPNKSKIVKKQNTITYSPSSRKFISLSFIDEGTKETEKLYGAYPITGSIHIFGGIDKTTSTGVTNSEITGIAYESCCWAFRLAHFKEDNSSGGYNYSTGMELVLTGLGSTSSPLKGKIEGNIPGYAAELRE